MADAAKKALRKSMNSLLRTLPMDVVSSESQRITDRVLAHPAFRQAQHIGVFLSFGTEYNTDQLIQHIFREKVAKGGTLYVPQVDPIKERNSIMRLVRVPRYEDFSSPERFRSGPFGILEPSTPFVPISPPTAPPPPEEVTLDDAFARARLDLIIIPGVAFDRNLGRMGRGKGMYDRFLAECESRGLHPYKMGVAFSAQMVPEVPRDAHDILLDAVITGAPTDGVYMRDS
ncbi:putative 5-formyltetrahydrofolate cyclo-ligase [Paratrimastix pyriformis]|uniref:5-formyltetrahydrofolate cyclo-ligase n=1 Tax=Paratrimastix pyriformis TaxID=342808 RepID=A0ABQ8UY11_9EUKA|nr:putative 5-formyltetrahydrofolate cyclo-ligase [Paratrimastix pyriformis]